MSSVTSGQRHDGGDAAWPDRQQLSRRRARFADLLRAWASVAGIRRVRFNVAVSDRLHAPVLRGNGETPAVCEHVHLPVQSAVLGRSSACCVATRDRFISSLAALRAAVPGISLSTDIIVGFPGETEEEFQEQLSAGGAVRFDDAYTFQVLGPLRDTPARADQGSRRRRDQDRADRPAHSAGCGRRKARRTSGSSATHEVLVEGQAKRGALLQARTRTNKIALLDVRRSGLGLTGGCGSPERRDRHSPLSRRPPSPRGGERDRG